MRARRRQTLLVVACLTTVVSAAAASQDVPQAVRIVFGLPAVLLAPGFAVVSAALPDAGLAVEERLLAILGISMVVAILVSAGLAAAPIGLSRESFALLLAGTTLAAAGCAAAKERQRARASRAGTQRKGDGACLPRVSLLREAGSVTRSNEAGENAGQYKFCVVGPGTFFLSAMSYYTWRMSSALAAHAPVSVILIRRLLPRRLYPGRARVGAALTAIRYPPAVRVYDGIDWFWLPSILGGLRFLRRERPDVLLLQWWTGTVLHTYLALAVMARLRRVRIVVEFHEVLDTAEARLPLVPQYVRLLGKALLRLTDGCVVHSEYDRRALDLAYNIAKKEVAVISLGPDEQHLPTPTTAPVRDAPTDVCNLLFFGTIRPYKGLEDLVAAFNALSPPDVERYWLTIVGETWEGWTTPLELVSASPYRGRITLVNRYVADDEVASRFAGADVVVLPYRRSSASGGLHVAMSLGLPVIVTNVGGLSEAAGRYDGAVFVGPSDPAAIQAALPAARALVGRRFDDPHSWSRNSTALIELVQRVDRDRRCSRGHPVDAPLRRA